MDFVIVWFVMTAGLNQPSHIAPQHVRAADMACGLPGAVRGVQVDRPVNPTTVLWPDPKVADRHCTADISLRVLMLGPGEYHLATTIVAKAKPYDVRAESYAEHDPHTTATWRRGDPNVPGRPSQLRITP